MGEEVGWRGREVEVEEGAQVPRVERVSYSWAPATAERTVSKVSMVRQPTIACVQWHLY